MDLDSASYRELQIECKARGLRASGTTEELRNRLKSSTSHRSNPLVPQSQKDTEFQPSRVDRTKIYDEKAIPKPATGSLVLVKQVQNPEGETSNRLLHRRRGLGSTNITALLEAFERANTALKERLESDREEIVGLQLRLTSLEESVGSMTASLRPYHSARNRFLSTFKKDKLGRATGDDWKIIAEGNATAEGGDAATDALLYEVAGGRRDFITFQKLYGLLPETVRKINHQETLTILNSHASVLSSYKQTGSPRFYNLFSDFIRLFTDSGMGCDVAYLVGSPTEVTNAYWAFINCIGTEVSWVESSNHRHF